MKNKKIELGSFFIGVLLIFIIIISFKSLYLLTNKVSDEKFAGFWFDVSLSIITSLFSAFVAYTVAKIQLNAKKKEEDYNQDKKNDRYIKLILIEMKDNKNVLELLVDEDEYNINDVKDCASQLSYEMLNRFIGKIDVEDEIMSLILKNYNKKKIMFQEDVEKEELQDYILEHKEIITTLENTK